MILETVRGSENIPEGAIKLTKEEALNHQKILVENWPSVKDVFFLRFGREITTAITFLSSAACINVFHPLLKFGRGTFTAVIPSILLPSILVYYKTEKLITDEVLTLKLQCPLCHHLKLLALQLYGGLAFPALTGLLNTNLGHGVPYKKTDTREYWKKTFDIVHRRTSTFQGLLFVQVSLAFILPYIQKNEITKIMEEVRVNPVENMS